MITNHKTRSHESEYKECINHHNRLLITVELLLSYVQREHEDRKKKKT